MHTGKAAPLGTFVQQRAGNDCAIAATATVTGLSYETIADAFGIPLDAQGHPDAGALGRGIDPLNTIYPLHARGWFAAPFLTQEHPHMADNARLSKLATSDQIKSLIKGRRAVLEYLDDDDEVGEHALAWNGEQAIDCSNGEIVDLSDVTIHAALILVRVS